MWTIWGLFLPFSAQDNFLGDRVKVIISQKWDTFALLKGKTWSIVGGRTPVPLI